MTQRAMPNKTTCPYCGVGCGISAKIDSPTRFSVTGDESHPANYGRLCSKGSTLAHTLTHEGRLLHPQIHGIRASWDQATNAVAERFTQIIADHGPDSVAFYVSGQLLTEDYYIANKFMKGFIGSANIDTNSRLCMSSAVAAYKRAFGEDSVPGNYEDLELADLMVLTGSNTAWCHPVLFQRIKAAREKSGMKVVVIDPRHTATCEIADLHLPIKPGTDVKLFNGLLSYLAEKNGLNQDYIAAHCDDFELALSSAQQDAPTIDQVAHDCELTPQAVANFYQWFLETERTVTCFSQGSNQSSQGTDKGNAIINCHLATGRVGLPGASPFSLTGQPNAMGGREVGGLANQLAAHMDFEPADIQAIKAFWHSDRVAQKPGLKAVELFEAIEAGKVKAVWIMGTNPVVSLPNANQVKRALTKAEFVVVSDCIAKTDTTVFAHVLLPAVGWGEKDGTVTNSERCISRQRGLLEAPEQARQDWRILRDVAHKMGLAEHFPYQSAADIFREHAALSGLNSATNKQFDISDLATISDYDYDQLAPIQWPVRAGNGTPRLYGDGQFSTASKRAKFNAVSNKGVANQVSETWPLSLNTGRIRDQWHTMTRTALAPQLNAHKPEAYIEINPSTAQQLYIANGDLVKAETAWGTMIAKAEYSEAIRPLDIFIPMHWNDQWSRGGRVGALVNPAVDPISGQPESKHTPCRINPWQPRWSALVYSKRNLPLPDYEYGVKVRGDLFYRYEIADGGIMPTASELAAAFGLNEPATAALKYEDVKTQNYRYAWLHQQNNEPTTVEHCLYIQPQTESPRANIDRNWLATAFQATTLNSIELKALLSGRSPAGVEDCGRTICACFGVGEKTIRKAIKDHNLKSATEVGQHLKAGTNCGSCISEIKNLF